MALNNIPIESYLPGIRESGGLFSNLPTRVDYSPTSASTINATATATAAQVASQYITSTSAAATTITLPTGTALGNYMEATQGLSFYLFIDNSAGANTVTVAVNTNAVQSDWDNQITAATASVTPATVTPLTIASGTSGVGVYRITFTSATAYVFSRVA